MILGNYKVVLFFHGISHFTMPFLPLFFKMFPENLCKKAAENIKEIVKGPLRIIVGSKHLYKSILIA